MSITRHCLRQIKIGVIKIDPVNHPVVLLYRLALVFLFVKAYIEAVKFNRGIHKRINFRGHQFTKIFSFAKN